MGKAKKTSATNKDYCKRYREKDKERYRKNDRERKQHARLMQKVLHPEIHKLKKEEERIRLQIYRQTKKLALVKSKSEEKQDSQNPDTDSSSTSTSTLKLKSFKTKQSFNRSIKKAEKSLPFSPSKKKEVIKGLAERFQLRIKYVENRGRKSISLSDEERNWLIDFFDRPDITYINPGRKDNVYIGLKDGERQYEQKKFLLWTLRDIVNIINGVTLDGVSNVDTFPDSFDRELPFTSLYTFVKSQKQLIYNQDIPQGSCLCEICENACLLAKGIAKSLRIRLPTNPHNLVEENSCDSNSSFCMLGECDSCVVNGIKENQASCDDDSNSSETSSDETEDKISFQNWCRKDKKIQKVTLTIDHEDAIDRWNETITELKKHIHRKRIQVEEFNRRKQNLEKGEAIVQCDYSENYKNLDQDEIQSAYFGHDCFSIFTACAYFNDDREVVKHPLTVISEASDHSRIASFSCFNKVVENIRQRMNVPLRKVYGWSDGMGAQFRSRFVFKLWSTFDRAVDLEWNYMEAHHGKGPMDGVGGTIKHKVFQEVKSGRLSIKNPIEFAEAAQRLVPSIRSLYLPLSEVLQEPEDIDDAAKIPETLQIHMVKRNFNSKGVPFIEFYKLSNDATPFFTQFYGNDTDVCGHREEEIDENTCGHCLLKWRRQEKVEWLQCPICKNWFHENCFHV